MSSHTHATWNFCHNWHIENPFVRSSELTFGSMKDKKLRTTSFGPIRRLNSYHWLCTHAMFDEHAFPHLSKYQTLFQTFCQYFNCLQTPKNNVIYKPQLCSSSARGQSLFLSHLQSLLIHSLSVPAHSYWSSPHSYAENKMYVCMYVNIHPALIHWQQNVCVYVCEHSPCTHTLTTKCMCVCMWTFTPHSYTENKMYVCMYVCMWTFTLHSYAENKMYVYMYVNLHTALIRWELNVCMYVNLHTALIRWEQNVCMYVCEHSPCTSYSTKETHRVTRKWQ